MKLKNIDLTLKRMIELLRMGGEVEGWTAALEGIREDFHSDPKYASSKLMSMYGGMGSLNDLVLYSDGQALVVENNEFDMLRAQLYELVKS
ncbi:MAG: DUF6966 domain-containing protein [Pseudomonas palmensis]|uniref:DUF6966 domain-containing protein n=1 Tax=Pseudomonas palmensis TaxID=2815362 RepID=UPI003D119D62